MNLAFFMNLRDLDASEIGESRHTRHVEWAIQSFHFIPEEPDSFLNVNTMNDNSSWILLFCKQSKLKPKTDEF